MSTPEQLRAVADAIEAQDMALQGASIELETLLLGVFPVINDVARGVLCSVARSEPYLRHSVVLSLRIDALLLEQANSHVAVYGYQSRAGSCECGAARDGVHRDGCPWIQWVQQENRSQDDKQLVQLVRQHASGRETGEGRDG